MLAKPIALEEKTGFKNLAVMGGIDKYILSFLSKAFQAGEINRDSYLKAAESVGRYENSGTSERKTIIESVKARFLSDERNPDVQKTALQKQKLRDAKAGLSMKVSPSLASDARYLKGVGSGLGSKLKSLGINTAGDLFSHYPRRYEDRSNLKKIIDLSPGEYETVLVKIISKKERKIRRNLSISNIIASDDTGTVALTWFNQSYRTKAMAIGDLIYASGKPELKTGGFEIASPEIEAVSEVSIHTNRIVPIYPLSETISQRTIRKIVKTNIDVFYEKFYDVIPLHIRLKRELMDYREAVKNIHFPASIESLTSARTRLKYEELFFYQLRALYFKLSKEKTLKNRTYNLDKNLLEQFKLGLPFSLTSAQSRVIKEIILDLASPSPMNRMIQGDVGSGKTIVAAAATYIAAKSGFQVAVMAPTEILAIQHFKKFSQYLSKYGLTLTLLTGSAKKKEREDAYQNIALGNAQIVIGTHALIQEGVTFANLGLVVIDEQHRFGVLQRTELQKKGSNPDMLVMTATPIPRTLSLTLYGDLESSAINELPPGRKKIKSYCVPLNKLLDACKYIKREIKEGRQAYIVCPLIDESDKIEAKAALTAAEELKNGVFSDVRVNLIHGKMKNTEKEQIMTAFLSHQIDVLISTTVIEVGVDVPNATIMVIMNAERFGLAQLHQLRGRIGRGIYESKCFFVTGSLSLEGRARMNVIVSESDGFKIAEKDLELRGPGEFYGTRQHGLPEFQIADLSSDGQLAEYAREDALAILKSNPEYIEQPEVKTKMRLISEKPSEMIH